MTVMSIVLLVGMMTACMKESQRPPSPAVQVSENKPKSTPISIQLPCDWKANQTHRYHVTEQRFEHTGQILKRESKSSIEIKTISENPLVISWAQEVKGITINRDASPTEERQKQLSEAIQKKLRGISLTIEFDKEGNPVRIVNLKAVSKKVTRALTDIKKIMTQMKLPSEMISQYMTMLRANYSNPKRTEAGLLRDVSPLFFVSCSKLALNQPLKYKDALPNSLGGPPIPSLGEYLLLKVDERRNLAMIEWNQKVNPETGPEAIRKTLNGLMAQNEPYAMPLEKDFTIDISDNGLFTIDTRDGWLKEAKITRQIDLLGRKRIEKKTYVRTSLSAMQ